MRRNRAPSGAKTSSGISKSNKRRKSEKVEIDWEEDSDQEFSELDQEHESEEDKETADEKRIRLAQEYLTKLDKEVSESDSDSADENDDPRLGVTGPGSKTEKIAKKIENELLNKKGRLRRPIASALGALRKDKYGVFKSKWIKIDSCEKVRKPITSVVISEAGDLAYTSLKDGSIICWDVENMKKKYTFKSLPKSKTFKRIKEFEGHRDEVLCLALSSDGRYLASAGKEALVYIWDTRTNKLVEKFRGHRDNINGLSFQIGTHTLLSASSDRSIRVWKVSELAFVEELYGHQSAINSIDSLYRERGVSCSDDRSIRFWKIPEETQLVFPPAHLASIDCVKMIDEVHFFAGSQDGSLSLWHTSKKKPCGVIQNAHNGEWITAVAALRNSDVVASGSHDGYIKLWHVDLEHRKLFEEPIGCFKVEGFVTALDFVPSGGVLSVALSKEPRLGRWKTAPEAENKLVFIRFSPDALKLKKEGEDDDSVDDDSEDTSEDDSEDESEDDSEDDNEDDSEDDSEDESEDDDKDDEKDDGAEIEK